MLGEATAFVQHEGSSVNPRRQKEPHAHSINVTNDNRHAVVADLGMDKVMIYRLDADKGTLKPGRRPFIRTKAGGGPTLRLSSEWTICLHQPGVVFIRHGFQI